MHRRKERLLPSAGHATDAKEGEGEGQALYRGSAYIAVIFAVRGEREREPGLGRG